MMHCPHDWAPRHIYECPKCLGFSGKHAYLVDERSVALRRVHHVVRQLAQKRSAEKHLFDMMLSLRRELDMQP